jgi:hypothetical protein
MGVAPFPPSCVSMVALGIVDHLQKLRIEFSLKGFFDLVANAHVSIPHGQQNDGFGPGNPNQSRI